MHYPRGLKSESNDIIGDCGFFSFGCIVGYISGEELLTVAKLYGTVVLNGVVELVRKLD